MMKFLASTALAVTIAMPTTWADANSAHYTTAKRNKSAPFADKALEIYKTAVEMRTAKGQALVPQLAEYLARQFLQGGFPETDIHVLKIGTTAALIVRYRGNGSSRKRPISISAHMDVVDALASDWERDPFKLIEENGYFFGRGTLDNKLGITAVTTSFLRLKAEGWLPNRDLIIAFSGDEETSMLSTRAMVNEFRALIDSEFVLNADAGWAMIAEDGGTPVSFDLQAAEKTYVDFELTIRNPGGHSSRPRVDNAIYELADVLKLIQAYQFPINYNDLTRAYFKGTSANTPGDLGKAMLKFAQDPSDKWAIEILLADPTTAGTISTTCVATMLKAGHAVNALPQSATANVNCRIFPGEGVQATLAVLKKIAANAGLEIVVLGMPTVTEASPLRDDVLAALRRAVNLQYPGLKIIPSMSPSATDGMHFRAAGIPSYGVNGAYIKASDIFAHGLNERIPVESFYANLAHWYVLLKAIAG